MDDTRFHTAGADARATRTRRGSSRTRSTCTTRATTRRREAVWLFVGVSVAIGSSAVWGDYSGYKCRRKLLYAPDRRAFGWAWLTIWGGMFVSIFAQLGGGLPLAGRTCGRASWPTRSAGTVHALCAPWAFFFGKAGAHDPEGRYQIAAVILVNAAALALLGLTEAGVWRGATDEISAAQVLLVELPYALFAGWLCVAAALSLGIAAQRSPRAQVDGEGEGEGEGLTPCRRAPEQRYSILTAATPAQLTAVPLVVTAVVVGPGAARAEPAAARARGVGAGQHARQRGRAPPCCWRSSASC